MKFVDKVFEYELSLIKSKEIKQFVIDVFDKLCPDYFWTCPCSTSGKYHPQVSLGEGGLVRHTKLAVWWGLHLATALGSSSEFSEISQDQLLDEIIATLLLHDILKNGERLDSDGQKLDPDVTGTHGTTLADRLAINLPPDPKGLNQATMYRILDGVACHMGVWTTQISDRPNNLTNSVNRAFANLIHLADYCASRKVDDIYATLQSEKQE